MILSRLTHWIHSRYLVKSCMLVMVLVSSQCVHATTIENIRVAKTSQYTRLVLDTSGTPSYTLFPLNNPPRIVVDLANTTLATAINTAILTNTGISNLRHAQRADGGLRLVLDLQQQAIASSFVLGPNDKHPHRLVIDLRAQSALATTATASTPTPKKIIPNTPVKANPKPRPVVIAIDAGHGGKDPGAIGLGGTYEKKVVLEISQRIAKLINAEPGMRAVMTRDADYYVTLRGRMQKARSQKADIFISVHADAVKNRKVQGSSVYILSKNGASSEAAKILAQSHDEDDTISGISLAGKDKVLQKVIVDLSQSATIDSSLDLAIAVRTELSKLGKARERIESAGFAVLKSPDVPSILVETAFISNPVEEKKLLSPSHQQKLAQAILRGVKRYLVHNAPNNMRYAVNPGNDKHTVRNGETLSGIAIRYQVSLDLLRTVNKLKTDRIRAGEELIIPNT